MDRKKRYVCAVVLLLCACLLLAGVRRTVTRREQQHTVYNVGVEDTSLSVDAEHFSSRLPILSIETAGQVIPGKPEQGKPVSSVENTMITASMQVFAEDGILNTLKETPDVDSKIHIRVRGNSSRTFDKLGYLFKFVDEEDREKKYGMLGMEKDSTWILHGPFLDKTLMRNYMWYNLSGQIMEWAPQARYCELFLNGDYQGVYVLVEQISVGEGRVEVRKHSRNAQVSSYIVCVDRASINDVAYLDNFTEYTRRMTSKVEVKYPGRRNLTPELTGYISKDFSRFEKALYSYDYDTRKYGYRNYIDTDSFVDYFIINEVTQNSDAGIYSTYFYKDVGGKLKLAVWDFNNCCDNYVDDEMPMAGFFMQTRTWYFMLMKDEEFVEKIIRRYRELRQDILSDEEISAYIADVQAYLGSAIDRNYQVWGYTFGPESDLMPEGRKLGSYGAAVAQYERRLLSRLGWMDEHIESLRFYSHESKNKKFNH